MTLEKTISEARYVGNGMTAAYDVSFPVLEKGHLSVSVRDELGNERQFEEGADYWIVVTRLESGVTIIEGVILKRPLAQNWELGIRRTVPLTQEHPFHNQGPNVPRIMEISLDKLTMICQEMHRRLDELHVERLWEARDEMTTAIALLAETAARKSDLEAERESRQRDDAELHALFDILRKETDGKADAGKTTLALAEKADRIHARRHAFGAEDPVAPDSIRAMPTAPDDGFLHVAAGGKWHRWDAGMGDPFYIDSEGYAVEIKRFAYLPNSLFIMDGMYVILNPFARPGDSDSVFETDPAGHTIIKG